MLGDGFDVIEVIDVNEESFKLFICGAVGCVLCVDAAALGEEW